MPDNTFSDTLEQAIERQISDLNTTVPGTIVSYDAARNRAVVRLSLPKRLADGTELAAPDVHEVPVAWPAHGGGAVFTFPVKPGDGVVLQFSQRSLDGWLSGETAAPDDPRRFDLTDAIALPGLRNTGPAVDADNIVLSMEGSIVTVEPGGTVRIKTQTVRVECSAARVECETMTVTGETTFEKDVFVRQNMRVDGDVKGGAVSLRQHAHTGVRGGAETSGIPVNGGGGI